MGSTPKKMARTGTGALPDRLRHRVAAHRRENVFLVQPVANEQGRIGQSKSSCGIGFNNTNYFTVPESSPHYANDSCGIAAVAKEREKRFDKKLKTA